MVKNYKPKKKQNQARKANAKIGRVANVQKRNIVRKTQATTKLHPKKAINAFLCSAQTVLLDRIQHLKTKKKLENVVSRLGCHHIMSLGSSQIYRLDTLEFDLYSMHRRSDYLGARSQGATWEDAWMKRKYFVCEGKRYSIGYTYREPHRYSMCMPWIGATPDFISLLTCDNHTNWSVIEVKSVAGNPDIEKYLSQIRVAMSCFGLALGFLVIYNTLKSTSSPQIIKVVGDSYLQDHKKVLATKFFNYIANCLTTLYGSLVDGSSVHEALEDCMGSSVVVPFDKTMLDKGPERIKHCYFWTDKLVTGKGRKGKIFRKKKSKKLKNLDAAETL